MSKIRISDSTKAEYFKEFLLKLGKDTIRKFNHFGKISKKNVEGIVQNELNRKDKLKFFVHIENELIAYGFLTLFEKPTKKHSCILGIVIGDKFQGSGFGKQICDRMIQTGWKAGLEKIWLTVNEENENAIKLYKSLGFSVEGIFLRDEYENKEYKNVVSMAIFKKKERQINKRFKIWKRIEE